MAELIESDEELLRKACAGPEGDYCVFEQLVHRYQGRILANCRCLTRDAAYPEDLAQEVFIKVCIALRRFEGRSASSDHEGMPSMPVHDPNQGQAMRALHLRVAEGLDFV